jgi:hypothetical protein
MVKYSVRGGAINGLYFYPKAIQKRAFEIGLTDRETVKQKRKRFMTAFYIVMLTALILIIVVWNRVSDFKTAYLQALLFLEVMNIYGNYSVPQKFHNVESEKNEQKKL